MPESCSEEAAAAAEPESFLPLNPRDVLILMALAGGPLHGYGLIKEAESLSDGRVRIDPANLYRVLKKLVRDGLVAEADTASWVSDGASGDGSAPKRRDYQITGLGSAVLAAETERLARLAEVARARDLYSPSDP